MVRRDETHATHIGGQRVDVVDAPGRQQAFVEAAKIAQLELVRIHRGVLRNVEVNASYPVAALLQRGDEVMTDEAAGAGDQDPRLVLRPHFGSLGRPKVLSGESATSSDRSLYTS